MVTRFVWLGSNTAHVEAHGVSTVDVEAAFAAGDFASAPAPKMAGRYVGAGTVSGRVLQVVFAMTGPDEVFVITAYWTLRKRRKP